MSRKTIIIVSVLIIAGVIAAYYLSSTAKPPAGSNINSADTASITNFEECLAAGNPVMESYPRQCRTKDARTFVEDIGNELEKIDLIRITMPRPGTMIQSPLIITGEARGFWFFEASFPVRLERADGTLLAQGIATAKSEWMTESFVPFETVLTFSIPETGNGRLVLIKDNPSGLPEYDDELTIPIRFDRETVADGCRATGCSSHICADHDVVSTCEWAESYACYRTARCERQIDGTCDWTTTPALTQCLAETQ